MKTPMVLNLFRGLFLLGNLILSCDVVLARDPADYVNPLIGTSSMNPTKEERARLPKMDSNFDGFHGKLFPGAAMIQLDGGKDLFIAKLRDFFERTPDFSSWSPYSGIPHPYHARGQEPWWNPYNNPVNEPTELISLLFNRAVRRG